MQRTAHYVPRSCFHLAAALFVAFPVVACGDDSANSNPSDDDDDDGAVSGFAPTSGSTDPDAGPGPNEGGGTTGEEVEVEAGTDDGELESYQDLEEICDAGDEAFVKRLIPFVQGRQPESIREVRLLVSMIEQLDAQGLNGRAIVTRGLSAGDIYIERWKTYLYEQLRINVSGDRRNEECYDTNLPDGLEDTSALAQFIRDAGDAEEGFGQPFYMSDVIYSGLRLDDLSAIYRAELFARMSAPLVAGNVDAGQLEEMRRANYGLTFEQAYLGRTTECNECHRTEQSTTDDAAPALDRHWPLDRGNLELAVYGPNAAQASANRSHAVFRVGGFSYGQDSREADNANDLPAPGSVTAFGFAPECGSFLLGQPVAVPGDFAQAEYLPFMISDYANVGYLQQGGLGATVFELDLALAEGFDTFRADGFDVAGLADGLTGPEAATYLLSMNVANHAWIEAMGYPLVVANNFPRNPAQRDTLQELADTFATRDFSLRALIEAIATHRYFNQAPPSVCDSISPYPLAAVFDPFARESSDPSARGNGVGDGIHRRGARVTLSSIAHSMWWAEPDLFGPNDGEVPGSGNGFDSCGGNNPQNPCDGQPLSATILRDLGAFLSDSEGGFHGTDLVTMLRMENEFGLGEDPDMGGTCTGPLGQACANDDWITQLVSLAQAEGATVRDVIVALKDRIVTEPEISTGAEEAVLRELAGVDLETDVNNLADPEQVARRVAGMLFNTPQFMLVGVSANDQDPGSDPSLVVPGTDTEALCNFLATAFVFAGASGQSCSLTCSGTGVTIGSCS